MPLTVVFVERKTRCDEVADALRGEGIPAVPLHGGLSQVRRHMQGCKGLFISSTLPSSRTQYEQCMNVGAAVKLWQGAVLLLLVLAPSLYIVGWWDMCLLCAVVLVCTG